MHKGISAQGSFTIGFLLCFGVALPMTQAQGMSPRKSTNARAAKKPVSLRERLSMEARRDYDDALPLLQNQDYASALVKFQHAYEVSKEPRLLLNIATCEVKQSHFRRAHKALMRFLQEGAYQTAEEEQQEAQQRLMELAPYISHMRIYVEPVGADIVVDEEPMGVSPLSEPVLMDLGSHRIRVSKVGYWDATSTVQISGGADTNLDVHLEPQLHQGRLMIATDAMNMISMDGKIVGQGRWEGALPSGMHSVRVTARRMRPQQMDVMISDNVSRSLQVTLAPESEATRGGRLSPWVWVGGGVVAAAGVVTGGYFLLKPKHDAVPESIQGTAHPGAIQLPFLSGNR